MYGENAKYIIFEMQVGYTVREVPVVFPATVSHDEMAANVEGTPVSAGFVNHSRADGLPACYGKSMSLKLESREEDTVLIGRTFGYPLEAYEHDPAAE